MIFQFVLFENSLFIKSLVNCGINFLKQNRHECSYFGFGIFG